MCVAWHRVSEITIIRAYSLHHDQIEGGGEEENTEMLLVKEALGITPDSIILRINTRLGCQTNLVLWPASNRQYVSVGLSNRRRTSGGSNVEIIASEIHVIKSSV